MLLKNKKTGEIGYLRSINWNETAFIIMDKDGIQLAKYNSLAGLNSEWEDVPEEPKEYWYISDFGYVLNHEINNKSVKSTIEEMKSIGNYFLSREEAELVVRKLKAWKRLKDKGFRFTGWEDLGAKLDMEDLMIFNREVIDTNNVIGFRIDDYRGCIKDLDTCFGGEE